MRRFILTLLFFIGCSQIHRQETKITHTAETKAASVLHSSRFKNFEGVVIIEDQKENIKITANFAGLPINSTFGFHIHENGVCMGPDYKSAGDHFNPFNKSHGAPESLNKHQGDLGNLVSDSKGQSKKTFQIPKTQGDDLNLLLGKSMLIHANKDDLKTQPSGNSGPRIACGRIKPIN